MSWRNLPMRQKKTKNRKAQIHFYISLKMLGYFRGITPPAQQNKTLLSPLILQRLRYYLIGCCTVWILSTKHGENNVSRSPLCRLEHARLSKFISLLVCNASFCSPLVSKVCPVLQFPFELSADQKPLYSPPAEAGRPGQDCGQEMETWANVYTFNRTVNTQSCAYVA